MDAKNPLWETPRISRSPEDSLTICGRVYIEEIFLAFLIKFNEKLFFHNICIHEDVAVSAHFHGSFRWIQHLFVCSDSEYHSSEILLLRYPQNDTAVVISAPESICASEEVRCNRFCIYHVRWRDDHIWLMHLSR